MKEKRLKKESPWTAEAYTTVWVGFLLRLVMLIIILYIAGQYWDLYYLEDDRLFEVLANRYLYNARAIIDWEMVEALTTGWTSPFWAYVLCFSAGLTRTIHAARYINIVLSTLCIAVTYSLCYEVSGNQKTALTAARLFAFMPFSVMVCCFPIKDIFIMFGTMYAFFLFVRVQNGRKVSVPQYVLLAILLTCIYFCRGGVSELLLLFLLVYLMQQLLVSKKHLAALILLAGSVVVLVIFRDELFGAFSAKLETYGNYGVDEAAGLNAIRVTGITDIYKLPLAYAFAMLQPMKLEWFTEVEDVRPWRTVMTYANMTAYPIVVGSWLYMFVKKHNLFFWLSSFAMFSAVIVLSLGVSRHYLFLLPIHMINYSLYIEEAHENHKNRKTLVTVGTFALFVLVFCYSLFKVLF